MSTKANNQVPWRRLPAEPPKAWQAFRIYRDMNALERTTQRVADALGRSLALVQTYSRKHAWVKRVEAYDAHIDQLAEERGREAVFSMRKRHATFGQSALELVTRRILSIPEKRLEARDVAQLARVAAEMERQARGDVERSPAAQAPVNIDIGLSFGQNERTPTWLKPTLPANNDYVVYGDSKRLTREISGCRDLSPLKSEQLAKASDSVSSSNGSKMPVRLGADQEVSTQQTERPTTPPRKRRYSRGGAQPSANILPKISET